MSKQWKNGPRLTVLADLFNRIACGQEGAPNNDNVVADFSLFGGRKDLEEFYAEYIEFSSTFNEHFLASIPFVLEEECRLGTAILAHLQATGARQARKTSLQTIESAEAVLARTIVALSEGSIRSLSNSPTEANMRAFLDNAPDGSFFFQGSFFDLTRDRIHEYIPGAEPEHVFDFIYEDTGFQMYDSDRRDQIGMVVQNLSEDGIFCCLEKCLHPENAEYISRNRQQNTEFKTLYFHEYQIADKEELLGIMRENQVTLDVLASALREHFCFVELTWNSGNFYSLAASNSEANLKEFVKALDTPCIPKAFQYGCLGPISAPEFYADPAEDCHRPDDVQCSIQETHR